MKAMKTKEMTLKKRRGRLRGGRSTPMFALQKRHENHLQRWLTNAVLFRWVFSLYSAIYNASDISGFVYLHTKKGMPPRCYSG